MRRRRIAVLVVVLLVAVLGLGYMLATIPRILFTRSGCIRTEFDREAILSARWIGSHIHLQLGLIDNCCVDDLAVDWTQSGLTIQISVKSIVATPCRCMCSFDVAVDLGPLPISDYQIQVFHGENIVGRVSLGAGDASGVSYTAFSARARNDMSVIGLQGITYHPYSIRMVKMGC